MALNTGSLMFFSLACSGGAAEFKSIYEWLFARLRENGWSYASGDSSTFLDLFRVFRNTLHNNGAFYPPNGRDQEITWQGTTYKFKYTTIPDFYGWEFNIMLLRELISLNHSIMLNDLVANLPSIK